MEHSINLTNYYRKRMEENIKKNPENEAIEMLRCYINCNDLDWDHSRYDYVGKHSKRCYEVVLDKKGLISKCYCKGCGWESPPLNFKVEDDTLPNHIQTLLDDHTCRFALSEKEMKAREQYAKDAHEREKRIYNRIDELKRIIPTWESTPIENSDERYDKLEGARYSYTFKKSDQDDQHYAICNKCGWYSPLLGEFKPLLKHTGIMLDVLTLHKCIQNNTRTS